MVNNTASEIKPSVYYQLTRDGEKPEGESTMVNAYTGAAVYTDKDKFQKVSFSDIADGDKDFQAKADNGWIAMIQHYFVSAWVPTQGVERENYTNTVGEKLYAVGSIQQMDTIAPNSSKTIEATLYSGPQDQTRLDAIAPGLSLVVDYGWLTFLAKPIYWLLSFLYGIVGNWGWAIVLLTCIVKAILYPLSLAGYRSMAKMKDLGPRMKALKEKYGDDKQKYQQELMAIYKQEGVSTTGGCLWSFIPLLILFPLYYVIREPLTYMLHNSRSISEAIVAYMRASGADLGKNSYYAQLAAAGQLGEFIPELKEVALFAGAKLREMNFSFLGIDLAGIPNVKFWTCEGWGEIGLFLIPVFSAGFQAISMVISQKMNNQVATNADGEKDAAAAKTANQTTATMLIMMPLMSLWIGYSMPAAISIYWIAQAVFGMVQEIILNNHFKKAYAEEDEIKRKAAEIRRQAEAEKERQRQLRREQNPDGIVGDVSKKKLRQQEKEAAEKAAREYEAKRNPQDAREEDRPLSGDAERPFCKGRAYEAGRYRRKSGTDETEE